MSCSLMYLAWLFIVFVSAVSPVLAAGGDTPTPPPPTPTGWPVSPFRAPLATPSPVDPELLTCGGGVPDGWGTVTPSPGWLYYCSRCVDNFIKSASGLVATATPTPSSPTATPTPSGPTATPTPDCTLSLLNARWGITGAPYVSASPDIPSCGPSGCDGQVTITDRNGWVDGTVFLEVDLATCPGAVVYYGPSGGPYNEARAHDYTGDLHLRVPVYSTTGQGVWTMPYNLAWSLWAPPVSATPTPAPAAWGAYCGTVQSGTDPSGDWFSAPTVHLQSEGDCLQVDGFDIFGVSVPGLRLCFQEFWIDNPVLLGVTIPLQEFLAVAVVAWALRVMR
jgi:hypothetical protein